MSNKEFKKYDKFMLIFLTITVISVIPIPFIYEMFNVFYCYLCLSISTLGFLGMSIIVITTDDNKENKIYKEISSIRKHFLNFGYDLSELTDDEIIQGFKNFGSVLSKSGITVSEASEAFKRTFSND